MTLQELQALNLEINQADYDALIASSDDFICDETITSSPWVAEFQTILDHANELLGSYK